MFRVLPQYEHKEFSKTKFNLKRKKMVCKMCHLKRLSTNPVRLCCCTSPVQNTPTDQHHSNVTLRWERILLTICQLHYINCSISGITGRCVPSAHVTSQKLANKFENSVLGSTLQVVSQVHFGFVPPLPHPSSWSDA
jgi:hypothetical protein